MPKLCTPVNLPTVQVNIVPLEPFKLLILIIMNANYW